MADDLDPAAVEALDELCRLDDEFAMDPADVRWVREQAQKIRAALAAARDREAADQHVTVVPVPGHPSRELVLHAGGRVSWRDVPGYDLAAERAVLDEEPEVRRG